MVGGSTPLRVAGSTDTLGCLIGVMRRRRSGRCCLWTRASGAAACRASSAACRAATGSSSPTPPCRCVALVPPAERPPHLSDAVAMFRRTGGRFGKLWQCVLDLSPCLLSCASIPCFVRSCCAHIPVEDDPAALLHRARWLNWEVPVLKTASHGTARRFSRLPRRLRWRTCGPC